MPKLNQEVCRGIKVKVPSLTEQSKIGKMLTLMNERIEVQIRIIDKLKSLMQGLNNELMDNPKWKKVYVGDFMEFFPTNSLSWEQLSYDSGQVRNLHYGLIHSGLPTLVDCQKESLPYIQDSSLPKQYTDSKDGDVAFADASEDTAEVGKVVELTNIDDKKIVCGLHTIHGRDVKGMTVKGFKGFAFNSKYFHDQLRRIAQGSKVYSINTDNLKSCYLCIPTITEQKKIVGLLHCLQDKIGVAEQELFLYESQKRFLLNNLFV
jgi:type I restriction enzyme S subunit